ncbi:unnamed protein product [Taenia asiatica]|uniref:Uncharacterized protein n=1 Tax=Taenia asiatica TaxID=60517 RepID=A0A0R3WFE3_TAEAS|nr:unnamed protein product [Taenia asiatica]
MISTVTDVDGAVEMEIVAVADGRGPKVHRFRAAPRQHPHKDVGNSCYHGYADGLNQICLGIESSHHRQANLQPTFPLINADDSASVDSTLIGSAKSLSVDFYRIPQKALREE